MPELPEVQTTVNGLKNSLVGLKIKDIWTDLAVKKPKRKDYNDTLKSVVFFKKFKKNVINHKIIGSSRRAKNVLIHLANSSTKHRADSKTILIHMKMTGHLLYGKYKKVGDKWQPAEIGPLQDPYNRFIHAVFTLSNGKHLVFCDTRKFGKITLLDSPIEKSPHLSSLGPEPLDKDFNLVKFSDRLFKRPNGLIKIVLMDQVIIAGIGNIYSDEILWMAGIHPEERVKNIPKIKIKEIFKAMKIILKKGIDFGGDSMSDYRNLLGEKGNFQHHHNAYRRKGEHCKKRGCNGIILRKVVGSRSAHYCSKHQKIVIRL
ncbi:MAG: Formamidopyrimidine-DNA glycosylase [Candidatus Nomurabacteria bacterium GW2011_GWB1_37_5]|uniref:Formamidopyrimidine-DNA glycosylase n=1 Tax=Candidatus Nomurabacteria bacterium GW2011_GWB1_37_5 TaxID=1618742 RepID=A0A0G0GXK7_9BACT|nr:MAG: Formamidopyrimidine-DNA glycosylase [Candidatus Nomurabacteria bacterium GW2011_GWB1_37_5]